MKPCPICSQPMQWQDGMVRRYKFKEHTLEIDGVWYCKLCEIIMSDKDTKEHSL